MSRLEWEVSDLKQRSLARQRDLKEAIKERERKTKKIDECRESVDNLAQWISDNQRSLMTTPEMAEVTAKMAAENQQIQQELENNLVQHKKLMRSVSCTGAETGDFSHLNGQDGQDGRPRPYNRQQEINEKWEHVSKQVANKKKNLTEVLDKLQQGDANVPTTHPIGKSRSEFPSKTEDVKIRLLELESCADRLKAMDSTDPARENQVVALEARYQDSTEAISKWFDNLENRLLSTDSGQTIEELKQATEALSKEIKASSRDLRKMDEIVKELECEIEPNKRQLVDQMADDMKERLDVLEQQAHHKEALITEQGKEMNKYQMDVEDLQNHLAAAKENLSNRPRSPSVLDDQIQEAQELSDTLKGCEANLSKLRTKGETLASVDVRWSTPPQQQLAAVETSLHQLQQQLAERQYQYERMLTEYSEYLDPAQEKLQSDKLTATDLDHLKQQLEAHKD